MRGHGHVRGAFWVVGCVVLTSSLVASLVLARNFNGSGKLNNSERHTMCGPVHPTIALSTV